MERKWISYLFLILIGTKCNFFQNRNNFPKQFTNYEHFESLNDYLPYSNNFSVDVKKQYHFYNKKSKKKLMISTYVFKNSFSSLGFFFYTIQYLQPNRWLKIDPLKAIVYRKNIMRPLVANKLNFNYYNEKNLVVYLNQEIIHLQTEGRHSKKQWTNLIKELIITTEKIQRPLVLSLFSREQTRLSALNYKLAQKPSQPMIISSNYFYSPWVSSILLNSDEYKTWRELAIRTNLYFGFKHFSTNIQAENSLYKLSSKNNNRVSFLTQWYSAKHKKEIKVVQTKTSNNNQSYFVLWDNYIFALWNKSGLREKKAKKMMLDILDSWAI